MGKLTAAAVSKAKARDSAYKLMDGDGLQLRVATDGDKTWLVRYMLDGKERQYRLPEPYGEGPGRIDLKTARDRAGHIRALARQGIDYAVQITETRQAENSERERKKNEALTMRDLFTVWVEEISTKRGKKGRADGGKETRRALEKDVLPALGTKLLTALTRADVLKTIRRVSARGHNRLAVMLLRDVKQMLRFGDANQPYRRLLIDCDVLGIDDSDVVTGKYDPVSDNERTRVLTEDEISELNTRFPDSGLTAVVQAALWIIMGCGTRVGETVAARWEHVDMRAGVWHIPSENTKTQTAIDILLSDFVLHRFQALWNARAKLDAEKRSDWVFPSRTSPARRLNDQTVGKALADRQRKDGKPISGRTEEVHALLLPGGVWKCHDLRRTAATLMQKSGIAPEIAHRCLNHAPANKLDRIYLQHDYTDEMKAAWAALGERLDKLVGGNVIVADFSRSA